MSPCWVRARWPFNTRPRSGIAIAPSWSRSSTRQSPCGDPVSVRRGCRCVRRPGDHAGRGQAGRRSRRDAAGHPRGTCQDLPGGRRARLRGEAICADNGRRRVDPGPGRRQGTAGLRRPPGAVPGLGPGLSPVRARDRRHPARRKLLLVQAGATPCRRRRAQHAGRATHRHPAPPRVPAAQCAAAGRRGRTDRAGRVAGRRSARGRPTR